MTKTSVSPNQSFFDSPETEVSTFWKQMNDSDFTNYPLEIEGNFYIRTRNFFKEQSSCILAIRSTFLIFKKVKCSPQSTYLPRKSTIQVSNILILKSLCTNWKSSDRWTRDILLNINMHFPYQHKAEVLIFIVKKKHNFRLGLGISKSFV